MSTNYYLHAPECPHCGTELEEPLHLGKSSRGWCFSLCLHPEIGLNNWQDVWEHLDHFTEVENYEIRSEYGDIIDMTVFFATVWDRDVNSRRHELNDRCIGHGNGPFDYIVGDFS